ncbi:uncharacterized protein M421DRAFT_426471 [Didymella exigua CBS 183.55]|uniref:Zn(2)-C6 fungal-type domain-containing protein n=1 Tax=Didymella exigua CBS 183.55 TaxID=1150837 RepID=A0A6A5R6M5_9PLEO|nr:uncharacterized protein M421DRAFT_426471 [Didymella exigua CBS 183.55]KAF1922848.1 hypothetical protein M421DRAFT_426471 [Didymella exigua CBS 183.55]
MVYRGKPSSACGECRKRRSRCDQATPCRQCVKAGRVCPGYRNAVDLLFHDESAEVERKSKGKSSKAATTSTIVETAVVVQTLAPVKLNNFVVYQPWDDLGVHFFMSNYVGKDPAVSQLHYLPDFYGKLGYATSSLKKTIIASGLAGYARTTRRPDLIEQSTRTYVGAIRDINTALSSPQNAVSDITLMSIMMAAMFETMLVSSESGMHNVSKHLEGAMSVAYLSLQQRPPSDVFKALLSMLIQSVIMNCWIQHVPLPARYKSIRPYVPDRINPHSVHAKLVDVLSRVIEFRDDLKGGSYQNPDTVLQRALKVDAELKTFIEEMPTHTCFEKCWMPTAQVTEVQQLVYNWVFHAYPQQFAGHLWNNVRSCRIHLHQLVHQQCSILLSSSAGSEYANLRLQRSASESLTIVLAEEICATVPQLLSSPNPSERSMASSSSTHTKPASDNSGPGSNASTPRTCDASSPQSTSTTSSDACKNTIPNPNPVKNPPFTPGALDPASAFHLLLKLHNLTLVPWLPFAMKSWIRDRITWISSNSDPYSAGRLIAMVRKRPCDGFPVSDAPGQVPFGGICETIALAPVDQRLWFLAHSWLFVGIDWNADYYSEKQTRMTSENGWQIRDGEEGTALQLIQESGAESWEHRCRPSREKSMMTDEGIDCDVLPGTNLVWRKPHWTFG